jgi:hypothetical protein
VRRRILLLALFLSIGPTVRASHGQDTSTIDRGVRIGIIYRPGVRPGMVMLPERGALLDSVRTIQSRDLDLSDRFEMITLPGGDSIRISTGLTSPKGGGGAQGHPLGRAARRRAPARAARRRGKDSTTRCIKLWERTSPSPGGSPPTR